MDSIILSDIQNINIIEDNSSLFIIQPFFGNLFNNSNEEETLKFNSLLRKKMLNLYDKQERNKGKNRIWEIKKRKLISE